MAKIKIRKVSSLRKMSAAQLRSYVANKKRVAKEAKEKEKLINQVLELKRK